MPWRRPSGGSKPVGVSPLCDFFLVFSPTYPKQRRLFHYITSALTPEAFPSALSFLCTVQSSCTAETSGLKCYTSALKSCSPKCFSASLCNEEPVSVPYCATKAGSKASDRGEPCRRRWWWRRNECWCIDSSSIDAAVSFTGTSKPAKNGAKSFSLLLTGFGKSLVLICQEIVHEIGFVHFKWYSPIKEPTESS